MITAAEIEDWAQRFGVAPSQVKRDHLISHILEALGVGDFFGVPGYAPIKVYVGRDGPNTRAWNFEPAEVSLRYSDLPATRTFQCPTLPTFCAMKLTAWFDRHAPRDLSTSPVSRTLAR